MNILLSERFAEGFPQLGNVADQVKVAGRLSKMKLTTTCTLKMMRFSVTFMTIAEKTLSNVEEFQ